MITRRLTLAAPLALAACGTGVDPTQAIADAQTVVNGVGGVYAQFLTLYPTAVSPAQQASVASSLAAARAAVAQLSASASSLTTAQTLQAVEANVNAVLTVLNTVVPLVPGVPPAVSAGLLAASVLLPMIEAMIGQLQGQAPKVATARAGMSPEAARLILKGDAR